jgi:molybdopterin molybdotransferase
MLEYEEALARILTALAPPTSERLPLAEAFGRVLTDGVRSPVDLPLFDNSAMDGYAVRAAEVAGARPESPVRLRLAGRVAAGENFGRELRAGDAVRLFTGSPLPRGADAVVMQEDSRVEPEHPDDILILDSAQPGENVRLRGEDIKCGAQLVDAGDVLTAGRIALLAATGVCTVNAGRRPLAGVLATGSELKEPGQPLDPGQIYESNRLVLAQLVRAAGGKPAIFPLIPDTLSATSTSLAEAFKGCDLVVTSGGVSVGEMDFVKQAVEVLGGEVQFWRVAIRPGRPFVFGRCSDKFLFGLPGNPVSAWVTFLLLVRPALLRWQGASDISLPTHPGVLSSPLANPAPRRHFMRVKVDPAGKVASAGLQASHALSSLGAANGLVDVPPQTTLPAGMTVQVMRCD